MDGLMKKISELSTAAKVILGILLVCCTGPIGIIAIFVYIFSKAISLNKESEQKFNAVINNPNEKNVCELMEFMNTKLHGVNNHPDTWSRLRGLWNVVNRSNQITTPTKEKFLATLTKYGLYVNNDRIFNNYNAKADTSFVHAENDFSSRMEQDRQFMENSMEDARRATTPADHGGHVQGDGLNPSDTMAADAQRQMNEMNNMNNNNMGMF